LNNGSIVGGASIFETVEMDNESQNWLNFPIPGDYIEDCGIQTPEYSRLTVSSASTPADESLHLPQSKGPSFPPHSPTMNVSTAAYMTLPFRGLSPGVGPLCTGNEQVWSSNPSAVTTALSMAQTSSSDVQSHFNTQHGRPKQKQKAATNSPLGFS
jgi:hypothetical protein